VGITYEIAEGISIFGDYARAFSAPTLVQAYAAGSHFGIVPTAFDPGFGVPTAFFEDVFIPNSDLEAQTSDNFEVGIDIDREIGDGKLDFRFSYFHQIGDNTFDSQVTDFGFNPAFLTTVPFLPPATLSQTFTQTVNIEETTIQGIEVNLGYVEDNWYARLTYSNISAENDETGEDLNTTPGDKLYLEAGITYWDSFIFGANALFVGSRDDKVSDENSQTDSYDIFGLFATWQYNKNFSLTAGIDNLLDEEYQRTNVNNTEAGRNIYLSGSYLF